MENPIFKRMLKSAYIEAVKDYDCCEAGLPEYPYSFDDVSWFFDRFFFLYRIYCGKEHPNISKPKLTAYIQLLPTVQFIQHPFDNPDGLSRWISTATNLS